MILIDNINILREHNRVIREMMKSLEETIDNEPVEILKAKNGLPTIQVINDSKPQLVHSKYDPLKEAERYVEQFAQEVKQYEHVFFYGVGLGYHIEVFLEKYPHLSFTLYEPDPAVFYKYVSNKNLKDLPLTRLKKMHVEQSKRDMEQFLRSFSEDFNESILLVSLPSYEKIFSEQYQDFLRTFKEVILEKRTGFQTNLAFEQRWTINSMMNFPITMKTPNILHDINREKFQGKPALIVAAGPSLADEIENIRYIKEKGLAYIFSVGSAINALIEFGVYPDAACTYDPKEMNQLVFKQVTEANIHSIPLIYGSSVGFETLENYPGPKLHMITSQDTVAPYYLAGGRNMEIVNDAPSIAVVTLQLLYKLGCNPIVLVGQNLAYRDNRLYSKGIKYDHISSHISKSQIESSLKVESVEGTELLTTPTFNSMRNQIEMYISTFEKVKVYNTTVGGAKIKGANFIPLKKIVHEMFSRKVVERDVFTGVQNRYNKEKVKENSSKMEAEFNELQKTLERLTKLLIQLETLSINKQVNELERQFNKVDKAFKELRNNKFYQVFISPMVRVQYDFLSKDIQDIRFEKNTILKSEVLAKSFAKFLYDCKKSLTKIYPLYKYMKSEINRI